MRTLIADCETDGLLHDLTRIWCLGIYDVKANTYTNYSDVPESKSPPLNAAVTALEAADVTVWHNGLNFDFHALRKVCPGNSIDRRKIRDTMVMSRLADPERRSHTLASLGELIGFPKGEHNEWSKWSPEMETYMKQDIRVTYKLYQKLSKLLETWGESVQLEHDVAWVIGLQMLNGFGFDTPEAVKLLGELQQEKQIKEDELRLIFPPILVPLPPAQRDFTPKRDNPKLGYVAGAPLTRMEIQEFNPGSRTQIANRLIKKYGWVPTVFTPQGSPEISEGVLKELPYPEARPTAEYLRLDKMVGMLNSPIAKDGSGGGWLMHEKNDRIHGYVNPNGAITSRMTHSKPNVAQADTDERMRRLWGPRRKGSRVPDLMGSTALSPVDWKQVGCDAEGLELRMMGHYLARYDGGEFIKSVIYGKKEDGTDTHTRTRNIVGLYDREWAKTFIYAMIFGAGNEKLGTTILADAHAADKPVHADYLALRPKNINGAGMVRWKKSMGKLARDRIETGIKGLKDLKRDLTAAAKKNGLTRSTPGWIKGLDGRRVGVRSEHSSLNTLFQSAGAICMKKALQIYHNTVGEKYVEQLHLAAYMANVHDEVQQECDPSLADLLGKSFAESITAAGEAFKLRCPLAGKSAIGDNWSETH